VINTINQTSSFPSNKQLLTGENFQTIHINKQLLTGENFQTIHIANTDRIGSLH